MYYKIDENNKIIEKSDNMLALRMSCHSMNSRLGGVCQVVGESELAELVKSREMIELIEKKHKQIQQLNEERQIAEKALYLLKILYVKDAFGIEQNMIFTHDKTKYAIDCIHMFLETDADHIYLSCSRFLKSGKWSVRTKDFTIQEYLDIKESL